MADREVIVTGAGSGLGRAMTLRLLGDGFRCTLTGPEEAGLRHTVELAGDRADQASIVVGDLRSAETRDGVIEHAAGHGHLFGLVNNAGTATAEPLLDETVEQWRNVFQINVEAAYFLAQQAIERMRGYDEGRVVNIGSIYGVVGLNNRGYGARAPESTPGERGPMRQTAYDTSKAAVIHMSKTLAAAAGRWGITVNAVSPGHVPWANESGSSPAEQSHVRSAGRPGLGQPIDPGILAELAEQVPLRRVGRADEIAGAVSFLLSDDAAYITGHNLVVDGGFTIW